MYDLPDFGKIFAWLFFGLICAIVIVLGLIGWGGYHLIMALVSYVGGV